MKGKAGGKGGPRTQGPRGQSPHVQSPRGQSPHSRSPGTRSPSPIGRRPGTPQRAADRSETPGGPTVGPVDSLWSTATTPAAVPDNKVSKTAKFFYTFLAFFAYWFGADRFDVDGDGDFDAADVQALMNMGKKKFHLYFRRPPKNRAARRERRKKHRAKRMKREAEEAEEERVHMEALERNNQLGGVQGAIANIEEHWRHGVASGAARNIFKADVEDDAGAQEDEILDTLKQYWPYFTIAQLLLLVGIWAVMAFQTRAYVPVFQGEEPIDRALIELPYEMAADKPGTLNQDICKRQCNKASSCVGIGWKRGPFPECYLLKALPTTQSRVSGCETNSWQVLKKRSWQWPHSMMFRGGLETIWPGMTILSSMSYCEESYKLSFLWRWWSYQYTHGSIAHVGANCLMLFMLGIPLEGYQGTFSTALMWTIGVLGGALCWVLFDPYKRSFGASGGCYSLLGMHLADHLLNWGDKKWRYCTLFLMASVTGVELIAFAYTDTSSKAHTVHIGGIVAGLLIGLTHGRNDHVKTWESVILVISWIVAAFLVVGSVCFWFFYNDHPAIANLWDPKERPFCWMGFACIDDFGGHCPLIDSPRGLATSAGSPTNTRYQCVMCTTRECVEGFYSVHEVTSGGETTKHNKFCPQDTGRRYCQFWNDGGGTRKGPQEAPPQEQRWFDIEYPPTRSAYQLTDTPAPAPQPMVEATTTPP